MKRCTIYDTEIGDAIAHGRPWPTADGSIPEDLASNLLLLEESYEADPTYDPATAEMSTSWEYDLDAKTALLKKSTQARPLVTAKALKLVEIDAKTRDLIAAGFDYDGHHFSLSSQAQTNLDGIQMAASKGMVAFPHLMSTDDDSVEYSVADQAALDAIYGTAVGTIKTHMDAGRALKKSVAAATTTAEVAAVVDNR